MTQILNPIKLLWAKSNRDNPQEVHLLIFHLLESAAVGLALWDHSLSKSIKQEIAKLLSLPEEVMGHYLAYWIGLHDIGKATPAFQIQLEQRHPTLIKDIRDSGLSIDPTLTPSYHSLLSGKYLSKKEYIPKEVEIAISGHHGKWDTFYRSISSLAFGDEQWQSVRESYDEILQTVLDISYIEFSKIEPVEKSNIFTTWFSGMICVADWLSSNEDYFCYQSFWQEPENYFKDACNKAVNILQKTGWIGWHSKGEAQTFTQMYHFKGWEGPNNIQQQAIEAYQTFNPKTPFIMLVEAPTGIGKTEIAMYLADQWLQDHDGSGLYIAMPTQATSNQIYTRSKEVLENRYNDQLINLTLAHGQARWNEQVNNIRVKEVGESIDRQGLIASEWFQNNLKRSLLTPFGVGTVDQVFLSILQTKHFFVRLFGLKNKVIIFDEVHAYDTYMNTLFHRLLEWLRAFGASVIILSATLPEDTRQEIISHYCSINKESIPTDDNYPRITLASPKKGQLVTPLAWNKPDREIKLNWIQEDHLTEILQDRLSNGGCAAIICNTVKQSQETFIRLKESSLVPDEDLILFHARFPFRWRQEIEKKVLEKFSKEATRTNGKRPQKAIVIATQVIEQSLDLDFDLMVTELAPIDLILQRAGRLHRHNRKRERPDKLMQPELMIIEVDKDENGLPLVGKKEPFYGKSSLLRTYFHLRGITSLKVVASTRELIENIYANDRLLKNIPDDFHPQLQNWYTEELGASTLKSNKAGFSAIDTPDNKRLVTKTIKNLVDDENTQVLEHLRAKTRDGSLGMRVPCLFSNQDDELFFDLACRNPVPKDHNQFDYAVMKALSQNELSISQIQLINTINKEAEDIKTYIPFHKHQKFLKFTNGETQLGGFVMRLSREIGFTYQKGGEE